MKYVKFNKKGQPVNVVASYKPQSIPITDEGLSYLEDPQPSLRSVEKPNRYFTLNEKGEAVEVVEENSKISDNKPKSSKRSDLKITNEDKFLEQAKLAVSDLLSTKLSYRLIEYGKLPGVDVIAENSKEYLAYKELSSPYINMLEALQKKDLKTASSVELI